MRARRTMSTLESVGTAGDNRHIDGAAAQAEDAAAKHKAKVARWIDNLIPEFIGTARDFNIVPFRSRFREHWYVDLVYRGGDDSWHSFPTLSIRPDGTWDFVEYANERARPKVDLHPDLDVPSEASLRAAFMYWLKTRR